MDADLKKELAKQTALLEENNSMLRKLRRAQIFGTITWFIKWIVILGLAFGFYYRFQPTILRLFELYDKLLSDIRGVPVELIHNLQGQQ